MKRLVLVIELDVLDHITPDSFDMNAKFWNCLTTWSAYAPKEGDAPIRLNIEFDKVEEL